MIKLRETSLALAVFNMLGEACGPPSYLLNLIFFFFFFFKSPSAPRSKSRLSS